MPEQGQPPAFGPFRASPDRSPKENALAFLEWAADGLHRCVVLSEANYRYSRALYESLFRQQAAVAKGARGGRRQQTAQSIPPPPPPLESILADVARGFVARGRIGDFIRDFLR